MTGTRRLFMIFWAILHAVAFAFSIVHYDLKDNLVTARATFGWTFGP